MPTIKFQKVIAFCKRLTKSWQFQAIIALTIAFSAVLVGLETFADIHERHKNLLWTLDRLVLSIFIVEILIRFTARARNPRLYFASPWNIFDLLIVSVCLLPIHAEYFVVMRLFRVLRVLRLLSILPQLQILVGALLSGIPAIAYIALLLGIQTYIYAALGVMFFSGNDPIHFGNIARAMLTLFQVITLEGWVDVLYIQMMGSDKYTSDIMMGVATQPIGQPLLASIYFISFILLGTMIVLNLFVGVIMSAIEEQTERVSMERLMRGKGRAHLSLTDQVDLLTLQAEEFKESLGKLSQRLHYDIDPFRALSLKKKRNRKRYVSAAAEEALERVV